MSSLLPGIPDQEERWLPLVKSRRSSKEQSNSSGTERQDLRPDQGPADVAQ